MCRAADHMVLVSVWGCRIYRAVGYMGLWDGWEKGSTELWDMDCGMHGAVGCTEVRVVQGWGVYRAAGCMDCGMYRVVGCMGCGMYGLRDAQSCGMHGLWDIGGCGMYGLWDAQSCGMYGL